MFKIMHSVKKVEKKSLLPNIVCLFKLCPIEYSPVQLFGKMTRTVHIKGDILLPIEEEWDANR